MFSFTLLGTFCVVAATITLPSSGLDHGQAIHQRKYFMSPLLWLLLLLLPLLPPPLLPLLLTHLHLPLITLLLSLPRTQPPSPNHEVTTVTCATASTLLPHTTPPTHLPSLYPLISSFAAICGIQAQTPTTEDLSKL